MESKIERVKQEMKNFFTTNPMVKSHYRFEWHTVPKDKLQEFVGKNAKLVKGMEMGSGIYGLAYADDSKRTIYLAAIVDENALILENIFIG